ncbi:histidinol dehydrogenase, partial [archaeon]|nr:histidinol dehydrogenase [archaeon]
MNVRILNYDKDKEEIEKVKQRSSIDQTQVEDKVKVILNNVKENGNKALIDYAKLFDKVELDEEDLIVTKEQIKEAYTKLEPNK